jgi:hypothetical protein
VVTEGNALGLHSQSGRASQKGNISGGVFADLEKISRALRRAVFVGLKGFWFDLSGRIEFIRQFSEGAALGYDAAGRLPVHHCL